MDGPLLIFVCTVLNHRWLIARFVFLYRFQEVLKRVAFFCEMTVYLLIVRRWLILFTVKRFRRVTVFLVNRVVGVQLGLRQTR